MISSAKLLRLSLGVLRGLVGAPLPASAQPHSTRCCHQHGRHPHHHHHHHRSHHLGVVSTGRRDASCRCLMRRRTSANKLCLLRSALPGYVNRLSHKQMLLQMEALRQRRNFASRVPSTAPPRRSSGSLASAGAGAADAKPLLYIKAGASGRAMSKQAADKSCTYIMKPKKEEKDQKKPMISVEECCDYCDRRVRQALDQLAAIVKCKARELAEGTEERKSQASKAKSKSKAQCSKPKKAKSESAVQKKDGKKAVAKARECKSESALDDKKKKNKKDKGKAPKTVCKKRYTQHLCMKRPSKKKSKGKDACKKSSKKHKKAKKKESSKDICKKKSSKDMNKKKQSSKDACKKKSSKKVDKKSSKDVCKKSAKKADKKKSSKDVCKKKSSKKVDKKKSSKGVCKKMSSKDVCKKKSSKKLDKKKSSKDICKKKSSKKADKKKSSKDVCKKKSSKKLDKKKSSKDVCKKKSSKKLDKKKSSKDVCKKKSSKKVDKKKSSKDVCKKKSSKKLDKKKSSKKLDKKKPSKGVCKKKSSKKLDKKNSSKDVCKKRSSKDVCKKKSSKKLDKKKSSKDVCKKKSSKKLDKKKSSKDVCKKKSSKKLDKKKSSKDLCKTKSSKDVGKKKSSKKLKKKKSSSASIKKKKSSKNVKKKKSDDKVCKTTKKSSTDLCKKKSKKSVKKKKSSKSVCDSKSSKELKRKEWEEDGKVCATRKVSSKDDCEKKSKKSAKKKSSCSSLSKKTKKRSSCDRMKKKKKKSKTGVKCNKSSQSVSQNEYCVLNKSGSGKGKSTSLSTCNAKLEKSSKKSMKDVCGDGGKKTKKKKKKKKSGMTCATTVKTKKNTDPCKKKSKKKKKKKKKKKDDCNSKKVKKCKSSKGNKSRSKTLCSEGGSVRQIMDFPGVDTTGKVFMSTGLRRARSEDGVMSERRSVGDAERFVRLDKSKSEPAMRRTPSFAQNLEMVSDRDGAQRCTSLREDDIPPQSPPAKTASTKASASARRGCAERTSMKTPSTHSNDPARSRRWNTVDMGELEKGDEVLIKTDGQCHRTLLNVPPDAGKIVLEIDLKNVNEGPMVTKITTMPNYRVEVEQRNAVVDHATESIRRLSMTKDVALRRPPKVVSEVKLYTLHSPLRKQMLPAHIQRQLVKYISGMKGEKPNTLVFEARTVSGKGKRRRDGQKGPLTSNRRAMHTSVGKVQPMIDPLPRQLVKDLREPAPDTFSCREPMRMRANMVEPSRQVPVADPASNWCDAMMCVDLKDKTFSDVFPPGRVKDGVMKDCVFEPGRCYPPKVKPDFGACEYYIPMEKPDGAACATGRTLDDFINPKKRDPFYARLCGKPLPIDECSTRFEHLPEVDLRMAMKRAKMVNLAKRLREEEEIRVAAEEERRQEACHQEALENVEYCAINFEDLLQCGKTKRETRRQQQECFKALAAKWNRLNALKKRRLKRRLQHPPTYTSLPKQGTYATFMDTSACYTLSPPGAELRPDYEDTHAAIADGPRVRQQWRAKVADTQALVADQNNPALQVYREETSRQLCDEHAKRLLCLKLIRSGAPARSGCDPKRVCTCQEKKGGKNEGGKKKSGKAPPFVGASVIPVMLCNCLRDDASSASRSSLIADAREDSVEPPPQRVVSYLKSAEISSGDFISRTAELIMLPISSMVHYLLPRVMPDLKMAASGPKFCSVVQVLNDDEGDVDGSSKKRASGAQVNTPNTSTKHDVRVPRRAERVPRVPAPKATELPSRESIVNAIATYLCRLFPSSRPDEPAGRQQGHTTTTVMPDAQHQQRALQLSPKERALLRLKSKQETDDAIEKAKRQLSESETLLEEVVANAKALSDKIRGYKNMESAQVRGTRAKLQAYYEEMVQAQHSLEKHIKTQSARLNRILESMGEARGKMWKSMHEIADTERKMERLRQPTAAAREVDKVRGQWQKVIEQMQATIAGIEREENVKRMSEHVKQVRHLVHRTIADPRMERALRNLERTKERALSEAQTQKIRSKARELKGHLQQLKELAGKKAAGDLSKTREESLQRLKAAAEEKRKEIKRLLEEVQKQDGKAGEQDADKSTDAGGNDSDGGKGKTGTGKK